MVAVDFTADNGSSTAVDYNTIGFAYWENFSNNSTENATDYDPDFEFDLWEHYIKPGVKEWIIMALYLIVFVVSMIGNILIIIYILKRKNLQTTVYYFMLNLAIADILVTLIALPPTLVVDIFESWMLGHFLCKLTPYLQMTTELVSTLSLGAISINRWFVVCHPLKASAVQSTAKTAIVFMVAIWAFSLGTLCPIAIVTQLSNDYDVEQFPELETLKSCSEEWESQTKKSAFHIYYFFVCYALPLTVLAVTYIKVFQELRKAKIPGFHERKHVKRVKKDCSCGNGKKTKEASIPLKPMSPTVALPSQPNSPTSPNQLQVNMWDNHESLLLEPGSPNSIKGETPDVNESFDKSLQQNIRFSRRLRKSLSLLSFRKTNNGNVCYKCSSMMHLLRSRRRSATMQVTLIVAFGICYAPNMILDLMRQVFGYSNYGHRESVYFIHSIAHLAMYLNSAINPIIYNIFSAQFRKEFRKTFSCLFGRTLKRSTSAITSSFILSKSEQSRGGAGKLMDRSTEY